MEQFQQYWVFAVFCLIVLVVLVRLVVRERLTLQASLSSLLLLCLLGGMALFPRFTSAIAQRMGFALASNFYFAILIGALAFLHLSALVAISRLELRTIALTQELGILQERLDRLARDQKSNGT